MDFSDNKKFISPFIENNIIKEEDFNKENSKKSMKKIYDKEKIKENNNIIILNIFDPETGEYTKKIMEKVEKEK